MRFEERDELLQEQRVPSGGGEQAGPRLGGDVAAAEQALQQLGGSVGAERVEPDVSGP